MTAGEKRDWMIVVVAALVAAYVVLRRKQAAPSPDQVPGTVTIPQAGSTPDYLSYNLPPFQKEPLLLPAAAAVGVQPVSTAADHGNLLLPNHSAGADGQSSMGGSCGCGCGSPRGGLVPSVGVLAQQYESRVPDLNSKLMANLLSAFPHGGVTSSAE